MIVCGCVVRSRLRCLFVVALFVRGCVVRLQLRYSIAAALFIRRKDEGRQVVEKWSNERVNGRMNQQKNRSPDGGSKQSGARTSRQTNE